MPKKFTAASADKYVLYQRAVQSADQDVDFLIDTYKELRGRKPRHLREDFCGTCLLSSYWVQANKNNTAETYDIDPEPLTWGLKNNIEPLGKKAKRLTQYQEDARNPSRQAPDVRYAKIFRIGSLRSVQRCSIILLVFKMI